MPTILENVMTFFRAKQYAAGINTYSVCDFTVVVFFYFSLIRALSFVTDVENMLLLWLLLFTVCFFIFYFAISFKSYFVAKLTSGARSIVRVKKSMCKKWHSLLSLSNRHIYSPHSLNVYQFYTLFLPLGFLRFVARLFALGALFFLLFSVLLFVVIENMYCEFYDF